MWGREAGSKGSGWGEVNNLSLGRRKLQLFGWPPGGALQKFHGMFNTPVENPGMRNLLLWNRFSAWGNQSHDGVGDLLPARVHCSWKVQGNDSRPLGVSSGDMRCKCPHKFWSSLYYPEAFILGGAGYWLRWVPLKWLTCLSAGLMRNLTQSLRKGER